MQFRPISYPRQVEAQLTPLEKRRLMVLKEEELRIQRKEQELHSLEISIRNKRMTALLGLTVALCVVATLISIVAGYRIWGEKKLIAQAVAKTVAAPQPQKSPTIKYPSLATRTRPPRPTFVQPLPTDTVVESESDFAPLAILPSPTPTPVFADKFDAGISSQWENANPDFWGTLEGRLISLKQEDRASAFEHAIWIGAEDWQNVAIELNWVARINNGECSLFLAFNNTTQNEPLSLVAQNTKADSRSVSLSWSIMPSTVIKTVTYPFKMRILMQGNLFTLFVNDVAINQLSAPAYDHGKIGLSCSTARTQFDNFRVYMLK